jgi:hypothetical protein
MSIFIVAQVPKEPISARSATVGAAGPLSAAAPKAIVKRPLTVGSCKAGPLGRGRAIATNSVTPCFDQRSAAFFILN